MKFGKRLLALAAAATPGTGLGAARAAVLFWSTQARPVEEAQAMREQVMKGFPGGVD